MKTQKAEFEEKEKYYKSKIDAISERIKLLEEEISNPSNDKLKLNAYKMEAIELQATIEGVTEYWEHYTSKLLGIRKEEEKQTQDCEMNHKTLIEIFKAIAPVELNSFQKQIREQYDILKQRTDFAWEEQSQKNAYYYIMKEFLFRIKKIKEA